jgi:hypothetical protein
VCCSDTQGLLGFPWPPKRGWAKTCATLPWPLSGWSLQVVFFRLTPRSQCGGSGCQGGAAERSTTGATEERKEPGLDAGVTRALHCVALQGGRTAASRCRPGERPPSGAHPRGLPGHGKPSPTSRCAAHSPARERPSTYRQEQSDGQSPLVEGVGGDRRQQHGQSAAAPVPTAMPLRGRIGKARRSIRSSALPRRWGACMALGLPAQCGGRPAATGSQRLHGPGRGRLRRLAYHSIEQASPSISS